MKTKHIILGTDAKGLEPNATVISSLLAHTEGPVWVRIFSRDVAERRLESGRLTLEVIPTPEHLRLAGGVPAHVNAGGTFDRIAAIPYCTDWERAVVLDYDQVVIGDPTELFEMDLGEALAAGCLWGRSLGEACREWFGRKLPERWAGCVDYQYFYMGPVLNLKALREDGAYERFVEFTREAGMEEQIGLHIACQDRIVGINPNLNVITSWDSITKDSRVLHFTGPRKPWNHPELPGAQYWRAHETTWEELTCGLWNTQGDAAKEDGRWADLAVAESIKTLRRPGTSCQVLELGGWELDQIINTAKAWMNGGADRWIKVFRPHVDNLAMEQAIGRFTRSLGDLAPQTEILDGNPAEILAWLLTQDEGWENFDAVILHAPRRREDFLTEACMAWKLLRPGGVMVIHPVAQLPGKVGRLLFEETLESFVTIVADSIESRDSTSWTMLWKAGGNALRSNNSDGFPAVVFGALMARLEHLKVHNPVSYLYGTHLEALADILRVIRPGGTDQIIEFGGGHFSTPLLLGTGAKLLTVEQGQNVPDEDNSKWISDLKQTYGNRSNWTLAVRMGTHAWLEMEYPSTAAFCFVDGNGDCRKEVVEEMLSRNLPVVAAHDSEQPTFRYDTVNCGPEYSIHDFRGRDVWTRVWSRHRELTRFLDESPLYHPVGSGPSRIELQKIPTCLIGAAPDQPAERQHRYWNHPQFGGRLHPQTYSVPPMPGGNAYGCSAAHLKAVEWALGAWPDQPVLLMENDAVQTEWFQPMLEAIPADADIIWLGCSNGSLEGRPSPEFNPNRNSRYQRLSGVCQASHAVLLVTEQGKRAWKTCCERAVGGEMGASTDLVCSMTGITLCRQYVLARPMFFQPDHEATLLPLMTEAPLNHEVLQY